MTTAAPVLAGDWSTFAYDQRRSGWARDEVILNRDNVANLTLKWKKTVKNETKSLTALTAPIVITDVRVGTGDKDLVYIAGSGDYFYAIDTANGEIVWKKKFQSQITAKSEAAGFAPRASMRRPPWMSPRIRFTSLRPTGSLRAGSRDRDGRNFGRSSLFRRSRRPGA